MNWKLIVGVVIVMISVASISFFMFTQSGHEEETTWGSYYQEYNACYVDGSSSSLSVFHNDKEVDHVEYVLKAEVNEAFSSEDVVFDLNTYHIQLKNNEVVIDTISFSGMKTVSPGDDQYELVTETIDISSLKELENGTYMIRFVPSGSIYLEGEEIGLPSDASVFVRVGEQEDDDGDGGDNGEGDKVIDFESEVIWS